MRPLTAAFAAVLLSSCSGDDPTRPEDLAPAVGRYAYRFTWTEPGATGAQEITGHLVITYASADSVAGRWEVDWYQPQLQEGARIGNGYPIYARDKWGILYQQRVERAGGPSELRCTGAGRTVQTSGGGLQTTPATCSLAAVP